LLFMSERERILAGLHQPFVMLQRDVGPNVVDNTQPIRVDQDVYNFTTSI
jgi:hypothetical protein